MKISTFLHSAVLCLSVVLTSSTLLAQANPGLTAHYHLDETSGDALDASGNGNTLINFGNTTFVPGFKGNGAKFDGGTRRLYRSSALGYTASGANTWAFWVKIDGAMGGYLLDNVTTSGNSRAIIIYDQGKFWFFVNGNEPYTAQVPHNEWHHIVLTHNGPNYTMYLDGVAACSAASGSVQYSGFNEFSLGGPFDSFTVRTIATFDEVLLFPRALSAQEVTCLYLGQLVM